MRRALTADLSRDGRAGDAHDIPWAEENQRQLLVDLAEVRVALQRRVAETGSELPAAPQSWRLAVETKEPEVPSALDVLSSAFGLSPFERQILVLCCGIELDAVFPALCAAAQGDPARPFPTFGLALGALDGPHWSALAPDAPLRRWRLVEVGIQQATPLAGAPLRIDERVLHFLTGVQHLDERLVGLVEPVRAAGELVPSHQRLAERIACVWATEEEGLPPLVQLCGGDETGRRNIAAVACATASLQLFALAADCIPSSPSELEALARLWEREAVLGAAALYIEAEDVDAGDGRMVGGVSRLLERVAGPLLLGARDQWRPLRRTVVAVDVHKPTAAEQRAVWRASLGDAAAAVDGHVERLASQFSLSVAAIRTAAREARRAESDLEHLQSGLWEASKARARPRLDRLAQRIEPVATWDALVLPEADLRQLRAIAAQVMHRATVYEAWGFGATSSRGLGISALFAGASGTGKTLAAEVLAHELRLDLYRIDLSSVVSKYIGETEKNLRRVFDAAEDGGAILFFDEADALFGKRSEVKDSHDRYANIEVNYLLQRMEAYRGLAILATNMKSALDPAFMRRIRFVVTFPFPDGGQRAEIWRRVFPPAVPTEALDTTQLVRLNITGGSIRNIALNAAFLAAAAGGPVRMEHLAEATRAEYAKLEKPLPESEVGGWM
jgi:hypothetical protein